ncbi:unnamed protein product [Orchesella dallaii]|uniref:F-box domain-containing protein n=1 Tax=Orchesella dallaii TaxID=48710 RepID=A0ABP1SAU0_9HEXA
MTSSAKTVATESQAEEGDSVLTGTPEITLTTNKVNNDDETEAVWYHHFPADNISQIWLNIYEKLSQEDKVTFSQASKEWHDWVAPKRTDFLFPQVALFLVGTIPSTSAKQCRSVCRSWTQKLDSLREFYPIDKHFALETEYAKVDDNEFSLRNDFNTSDEIQRFMADMSAHPGNPLPGGIIFFKYKVAEREIPLAAGERIRLCTEYWTAVTMLLRKYGNYIQRATFGFGQNETELPGIEIVEHFRNSMLSLRNLRYISLSNLETGLEDEIEEYFGLNPLPRLQNLEVVQIHNMDFNLAETVLNHCCIPANIKEVWIWAWRIPPTVYTFFNLEILEVRSHVSLIEDLERFRNLPQVPPLKVLRIQDLTRQINAIQVFTAFEAFSDTITELTVMTPLVNNAANAIAGIQISLPKLERIYFTVYQGSLDLLLQLTSLKDLIIRRATMEREEWDGNLVQFYGFEERLKESNIWDLIPSLQTITVGCGYNELFYER